MTMQKPAIGVCLFLTALISCGTEGPAASPPQTPSEGVPAPRGFFALWPEHTAQQAQAAQGRADVGEDVWRLDPSPTAERFGEEALGWEEVIVRTCPFEEEPNCGPVRDPEPDGAWRYLSRSAGRSDLIVRLDRLVRSGEGGIWSVSWVGDAGKDLPAAFERPPGLGEDPEAQIEPGDELLAGHTVLLRSSRPTPKGVFTGYVYWGPCQGEAFASPARKRSVFFEFGVAVSDAADECLEDPTAGAASSILSRPVDGIVFAFTTTSEPIVDPGLVAMWLFDPARRPPDAAATLRGIVDIAAVPVRFVPRSPGASPTK